MSNFLLSWNEGVTAAAVSEDDFVVQGPTGRIALRKVRPSLVSALRYFEDPGVEDQRLVELVKFESHDLPCWYYYLDRLTRRGLLCYSAQEHGVRLATLMAISPSFVPQPGGVLINQDYVLSRFALLRRESNRLVVESPLSHARLVVNDCRTAALISAMASPGTLDEITELSHGLRRESVEGVMSLLIRARMLQAVDQDETGEEDRDQSLQTWSFHDLLFHSRSRQGRFDAPFGGTYRFAGITQPPEAIKQPMGIESYELDRPDLEQLQRNDPSLAEVQERRRSIREFDDERPITSKQFGEFLYRVARVKDQFVSSVPTDHGSMQMDYASRPYPAGGSLYEIEFYAVIQTCVGLKPGLYHYAPKRHVLELLTEWNDDVAKLMNDAAESTSASRPNLQILIILAARVPRVAWKYESLAYSLVLKHVGVIFQTMYLAATAMGLGPCAIGGGDSDLFARTAGIDYATECSVGEFLLGSARPDLPDCDNLSTKGELRCAITEDGH